jgi:hypothetical protein
MRLSLLITIFVMMACCWMTPAHPEPVLYLPTLAKPTTMPAHPPATAPADLG